MPKKGQIDGLKTALRARDALNEKHGEDTIIFDVRGISPVTDYMVVTSGSSPPHLKALFGEVQRVMKDNDILCYRRNGVVEGGWLLLDYVDVVIHIFDHEHRQFYKVEELWAEARQVD